MPSARQLPATFGTCRSHLFPISFGRRSYPAVAPAVAKPPPPEAPLSSASPDKDISNIFVQNEAWRDARLAADPEFFDTLGSVHQPKYLYVGTSAIVRAA